ncbi:PREDICTED: acidic amino acid decarboxylase GADL1-like isoform X2 [Priapulus caudatus]|uniref:Acidic amino acid decarboxylase GADL1-like isoform X2 n=1 Tax=Priapulus caudatus TaxID=37621 RepID=A0ABM1E2E1_PRICU|nr:PREDICTED: acidic amino acid decarboxylase GADL1-like isoform X2 [Priapulus caudatus]
MYGLVTARYKKYPMVKTEGVQSLPRMAVFGSEQGVVPILVCATSGTPTLGSCDALDRIANVCQNHQVWLHVDAYNLGGVLLSDVHRHLMHGINMADSVAWSPHGLLGVPLDCTVFLIKEKGLLDSCNKLEATYLFQRDKFYDVAYDIGDQSVQCGRKVDSGKLWIMWKAKGDIGMAKLVESAFTQARYFMDELTIRDGFRPVLPEFQGNKVGFWYIPPRHRNMNETEDWWAEIGKVSLAIKKRLTLKGSVILNCESVKRKGLSHFLQLTTDSSSPVSQQGVKVVLDEIVNAGNNL